MAAKHFPNAVRLATQFQASPSIKFFSCSASNGGQFRRFKANALLGSKNYKARHRSTTKISNVQDAQRFVARLPTDARELLLQELTNPKSSSELTTVGENETADEDSSTSASVDVPANLLKQAFMFHGVPFIGFGICDNLLLIIAGDYIDITLGVTLGISTLAAAALGNIVSDVVGIGFSGYIEKFSHLLGIEAPEFTSAQSVHWKTRYTIVLGRSLGITIGCFIGMLPLLFLDTDHQHLKEAQHQTDQGTNT